MDLTLERDRDLLRRGTVLVDQRDPGTQPRMLFYLEHAVRDGSTTPTGDRRVISRRMLYVELDATGNTRHLQYAPYLDYEPLREGDPSVDAILATEECAWIDKQLEGRALGYAISEVVPEHLGEVRERRLAWIAKARAAVKERLTKEISYWDHRAEDLKHQEEAGKKHARMNAAEARRKADQLATRMQKRMDRLDLEEQISAQPPVVLGGLVVLPMGLLAKLRGSSMPDTLLGGDKQASAARARAAVMEVERGLGFEPVDREFEHLGYDIESRCPGTGRLRMIEVKGRVADAKDISVTRNEILYSLNKPDDYILAIVEFHDDDSHRVHYVRRPFQKEPDFGVTSVRYDMAELLARAEAPR
jgi:hypothetical protein